MDELELWSMFGMGRMYALAKQLGLKRYQLDGINVDHEVRQAMSMVEFNEMQSEKHVKANILHAAKLTKHHSDMVRKRAYFALVVWSEIYGGMV